MFAFYDAGRVTSRAGAAVCRLTVPKRAWLSGVGAGFGAAGVRVEFGFRANDIPESRQILVRFSPTF